MPIEKQAYTVGRHSVSVEADDLTKLVFAGDPTEAEMTALMDKREEVFGFRPIYVIVDYRQLGSFPAPARRVLGERSKSYTVLGVAIIGAKFHLRAITTLVHGALALFQNRSFPQAFVDDDAAAF